MFNCEKCWDNPCTCGFEYRKHDVATFVDRIVGIISYKTAKEQKEIIDLVKQKIE